MGLTPQNIDRAARHIVRARREGSHYSLPSDLPPLITSEACAIHASVRQLLDGADKLAAGYKVSGTQFRNPEPELCGSFFAAIPGTTTYSSGMAVPCAPYQKLGVECELAVSICGRSDGNQPFTVKSVMAAVGRVEISFR